MDESRVDGDWAQQFQDGVDAYWTGKYQADNPYPSGEQAAWEWLAGWNNGREEFESDYDDGVTDWGGWDADSYGADE